MLEKEEFHLAADGRAYTIYYGSCKNYGLAPSMICVIIVDD
jgi:hypothetical protein